jgi:hypothetical protein
VANYKSNDIRKARTYAIKNTIELGVSFSVKTCQDYGIDWQKCLEALLDIGIRRFRLMSYWDLHEATEDIVDYSQLDKQLEMIEKAGARASLCIGIRQPRWPESHIPLWALQLPVATMTEKYLLYHQAVIDRYRDYGCIESWQLENEFWNRSFGLNNTFSRKRLKQEYKMIRAVNPERPIIMSLANTVGYPVFGPKPDLYATTMYLIQYENGQYRQTKYASWYFRLRRQLIRLFTFRDLIIHELQAEPWGPKANWEMNDTDQNMSMNPEQLKKCIYYARKSGIKYIDLWGGEWWFWRKTSSQDMALWTVVASEVAESKHFV